MKATETLWWRTPRLHRTEQLITEPTKPAFNERDREHHEMWLYYHLSVAREAAYAISRTTLGDLDFFAKRTERDKALAYARQHIEVLAAARCPLPELLREMARAEELVR